MLFHALTAACGNVSYLEALVNRGCDVHNAIWKHEAHIYIYGDDDETGDEDEDANEEDDIPNFDIDDGNVDDHDDDIGNATNPSDDDWDNAMLLAIALLDIETATMVTYLLQIGVDMEVPGHVR